MINVKLIGVLDQGAYDRATMICRALKTAGRWDGEKELYIQDAYDMHLELFGFTERPLNDVIIEPYFNDLRAYLPPQNTEPPKSLPPLLPVIPQWVVPQSPRWQS